MWDKVKAGWDSAASWATKGWTWVNTYTNGPLLALIALVVVAFFLMGSAQAQGVKQYPPLIDMDKDVWPVYTPNPRVIVFCEENSGADEVHLCQAWGMPAPGVIIPVSGAVYCFVRQEKEVIREGEPDTQREWGCGLDRSEVADEATRVGKEVKRWGRPIRPDETEVAI